MTLAQFMLSHMDKILSDWDDFARSIPAARNMDRAELRDHAREILQTIAREMEQEESRQEQKRKSQGKKPDAAADTAAHHHGAVRELSGFTLPDMVTEFRALRATVIRRWTEHAGSADAQALYQLTRFNEGIDQALAESTARFMERVEHAREMFLGIIGHDLRNPLGAVLNSAQYLMLTDGLTGAQTKAVTAIYTSGRRLRKMVEELLDVTRTRLGQTLPMERRQADLATVCKEMVAEAQAFNPERAIRCSASGDLTGAWDVGRLAQLLSNLLGNAIQHGAPEKPVTLAATRFEDRVELEVHNEGPAIPREDLERIFEPLVRARGDPSSSGPSSGLGLGLYIAREITQAHGGRIFADSSDIAGTTITVVLPRNPEL